MKQFIVVTALAAAMVFPAVGAEVQLTPDDDIQKALDAATPGDTIVLDDGVYYQNVVITRGGSEESPSPYEPPRAGLPPSAGPCRRAKRS